MLAIRGLLVLKPCALGALVVGAMLCPAPVGVAHAQTWTLAHAYLNPTPASGDEFGYFVAAAGGDALVGAPFDNAGASDSGAAYLLDTSSGSLIRTFLNPIPSTGDLFGISVASVGSNVLVGAREDDTGASDAGAAYLLDAGTGAVLHTFLNPTPAASDIFGYPVAGLGANVLISAIWDDTTAATDAGVVYLFDGVSGTLIRTFPNPTPASNEWFGYRLAALGGNVLAASPLDASVAAHAGVVHLLNGGTGALIRTFQKPTPAMGDRFGWSVATTPGANVLVGAPLDDAGATDAGAAYLFNGTSGALIRTFLNPTPGVGDQFGWSVAVVGSNVLVGALYDDTGATDGGAAYLFDGVTGSLIHTFANPTPNAGDNFGWWVTSVAGNALIGAPFDDTAAMDGGAAYLFQAPVGGLAGLPAVEDSPWFLRRVVPDVLVVIAAAAASAIVVGSATWYRRRRAQRR